MIQHSAAKNLQTSPVGFNSAENSKTCLDCSRNFALQHPDRNSLTIDEPQGCQPIPLQPQLQPQMG